MTKGQDGRKTDDDDELLVPPSEKKKKFKWGLKRDDHQTTTFSDHDLPLIQVHPSVHHMSTDNTSKKSSSVARQPENSTMIVSAEPQPRNYTALSVFTMLCCCLPLGLCALFYARDAQTMWLNGRKQEALKRARISRNLNIAGIVISSAVMITYVTVVTVKVIALKNYLENMSRSDYNPTPQP